MTVREQILSLPETCSDLAWAAEQRFRDAERLLAVGHFTGAIYLFGLACEMWLKLACFTTRGAGPATTVDSQLGPARLWMKGRAPNCNPESFHSLRFWVEYLLLFRSLEGASMPCQAAGELRHHAVTRLFQDWKIDLRYRSIMITERHAWRVFRDAFWIRQTWQKLSR